MREALLEARKAAESDEVPVGAIIVKDGEIIARAYNQKEKKQNATAHAEIEAIAKASEKLNNWYLDGCEMFVTLEPCPMCAGALVNARIDKLYYGAKDYKAGAVDTLYNITGDARLNHRLQSEGGILEKECGKILSEFFQGKRGKK